MAELADAQDLGSCAARRVGSTPITRTRLSLDAIRVPGSVFILPFRSRLQRASFLSAFRIIIM